MLGVDLLRPARAAVNLATPDIRTMSNYAYLYASDTYHTGGWYASNLSFYVGAPIADSRWSLPFAWPFFFDKENLVVHDDDGYESVQFIAAKDEAIALFKTRLPLLAQLTGNHPDFHEHIAALLVLVQSWEGQYLFLDDSEVMDMPAEESLPLCHAFFQSINQTPPDLALIVENLRVLESDLSIVRRDETEPDAFKRNLIGVFMDGED